MKTTNKKLKRGTVLPAIFAVLVILLFLVLAITQLGTTSLRQAAYFQQDDQALFASEAGLARAMAEYQATGELQGAESSGSQVMTGTVDTTGATYSVELYANSGPGMLDVPGGGAIPPGTALLISEGVAPAKRSRRRSAILVQNGMGTVQVGSLSKSINAKNTQFFAYDSNRESPGFVGLGVDPNSVLGAQAIIATNEGSGQPIQLDNSKVNGDLLVGPGGNPEAQVLQVGDSSVGRVGVLTEAIEIPEIEVPSLPGEDEYGDPPEDRTYTPVPGQPEHVTFNQYANGTIKIVNQCFTCQIFPDGTFEATESGTNKVTGNLKTGEVQHGTSQGRNFSVNIGPDSFKIGGHFHGIELDSSNNLLVDAPTNGNGDLWSDGSRMSFTADSWLADGIFRTVAPDETNPSEIETGYYNDVVINAGETKLKDSTTMVIKNLTINNGGKLTLPEGTKDVTLYVTGKLKVSGLNAILNETRKAPELKIFYTGNAPVEVSGGAQTFMTLIAPDAKVKLKGDGSTFFGALVSEELTLEDAEFYYDTATEGVGTGTDGTTMTVLAHQRL